MQPSELLSGSSAPLTGQVVLGRYRIVRPLARGGMGIVYLGLVEGAAGFAKPVVIKSVLGGLSDLDSEQRFAREARIVSNLQHPNIVAVVDFGQVGASHVMVLEYVHGYHLGQWWRFAQRKRGPLPVHHAVHVALCVLDALAFAHGLTRPDGTPYGIVHRDISPANVLIDVQGHIKLNDFGIAYSADDEYKTRQGTFHGTLGLSPPEAFEGVPPTPKLDQYAAGLVLYGLLAGKNPLRGGETAETIARITQLVPPPLQETREDVPAAVAAAIARAIAKKPEQRFASVAEFAEALRAGCAWSERAAAESFSAQIKEDFAGSALADELELESLAVRDASWRDAQGALASNVGLSSSPPEVKRESLSVTAPTGPARHAAAAQPGAGPAGSPHPTGRIALAVAAVALAAVLFVLFSRRSSEEAPRVLVIEKQANEPSPAPAEPEVPATAVTAALTASAPPAAANASAGATAPVRRGPAAAPSADRGAALARAFQRQESKLQGCFHQHSTSPDVPTSISIRFQIDAAGNVQRAQVVPSSVAGTPLGACLATIAEKSAFGPQPEGLSFSIPISTRVVSR